MVEHRLAKARVGSSNLLSRSNLVDPNEMTCLAGWQSGYAADCNSVYAGSIPTPASISDTETSPVSLWNGFDTHPLRVVTLPLLVSIYIAATLTLFRLVIV